MNRLILHVEVARRPITSPMTPARTVNELHDHVHDRSTRWRAERGQAHAGLAELRDERCLPLGRVASEVVLADDAACKHTTLTRCDVILHHQMMITKILCVYSGAFVSPRSCAALLSWKHTRKSIDSIGKVDCSRSNPDQSSLPQCRQPVRPCRTHRRHPVLFGAAYALV